MSYSPKAFEIAVLGTSQIGKFISTHGTTGDVIIPDDDKFSFGTGSDASIYFDAAKLVIADENIAVQMGNASSTVTILGNLTVSGDTVTQNVATVLVEDPLMLLAYGQTGSGAYDAGLIIERGDDANVGIIWDESGDEFSVINTSSTATEAGNVTIASYAAFQSAALTASTGTFSGILKTDDATDATTKTDGSLQTDGGLSVAKAIYNGTAATFAADSGIVTIGSSTAATFSAAGLLNINNATDATSKTDGSLQTDGGLSVAKKAYIGTGLTVEAGGAHLTAGRLTIDDATEATSATDGSLQTDGGLSVAKDIVGGDDLILLTDSAVIHFGEHKEVTLTHVHDSGLTLKHTATADDKPVTLTLATGEIDMAADDVIGVINFQAPDEGTGTDAILVAAGIAAVSEGDFAAGSNATKLSFRTATSEAASEKMSLSSGGNLTVTGDIILDDGGSLKEAGGVAAITFDGSANVTKIGLDTPTNGQVLTWTTTGTARAVWDDVTATTATTATNVVIVDNEATDEDNAITFVANADIDGSTSAGLESDGDLTYNPSKGRITATDMAVNGVFVNSADVSVAAAGTISKGFTGVTTSTTNRQMDLPEASATNIGAMYTIKKLDSASGQVKITRDSSADTIDGGTGPIILYHQNESVTLIVGADTKWFIM